MSHFDSHIYHTIHGKRRQCQKHSLRISMTSGERINSPSSINWLIDWLISSVDIMSIVLPPLPYAYDALEPFLGRQTLEIHHDKHHAKYVATANTLSK